MIRGLSRIMEVDATLPPLPRFPGKPDTMMTSAELLEERRIALEEYLNTILESDVYRENPEMVNIWDLLILNESIPRHFSWSSDFIIEFQN